MTGIESTGHSGQAEKGSDIVCAAVSVLMQSLILGIVKVAHVKNVDLQIDDSVPLMRVTWPKYESKRLSLLTKTTAESLKVIASDNPKYVKVISEVA